MKEMERKARGKIENFYDFHWKFSDKYERFQHALWAATYIEV
jgi:hypothetical protein